MTEVGPADRSRLLRSKQDEHRYLFPSHDRKKKSDHFYTEFVVLTIFSSILSTRKRKFSQFFAAAAAPDALPNHELTNPNAPNANPNDFQTYDHSNVLQYVTSCVADCLCDRRVASLFVYLFSAFFSSATW